MTGKLRLPIDRILMKRERPDDRWPLEIRLRGGKVIRTGEGESLHYIWGLSCSQGTSGSVDVGICPMAQRSCHTRGFQPLRGPARWCSGPQNGWPCRLKTASDWGRCTPQCEHATIEALASLGAASEERCGAGDADGCFLDLPRRARATSTQTATANTSATSTYFMVRKSRPGQHGSSQQHFHHKAGAHIGQQQDQGAGIQPPRGPPSSPSSPAPAGQQGRKDRPPEQ